MMRIIEKARGSRIGQLIRVAEHLVESCLIRIGSDAVPEVGGELVEQSIVSRRAEPRIIPAGKKS